MSRLARPLASLTAKLPRLARRFSSTTAMNVSYNNRPPTRLVYHEYGCPWRVVSMQGAQVLQPKENEVLVRMVAAPVHSADINTIEGRYPVDISPPTTPGIEGVGEIVETGAEVTEFAAGDRVVPLDYGQGTWRTHLVVPKEKLFKVPKELGVAEGATITSNPCAAYRMLKDFETLLPGDTVIQNAANSAAGQSVIQICKAWGVNTVNVLREKSATPDTKEYLMRLGASYVFTDSELKRTDLFKSGKLERPKLALNCVGGESAWNVVRELQPCSTMVTYGGMFRQPVMVLTSALVFKNVRICGFWLTDWIKRNYNTVECRHMLQELVVMYKENRLKPPVHDMIGYDFFQDALMKAVSTSGLTDKKYIINFDSM